MSVLDDMVKNQFGAPLSEALQSIITGLHEKNAQEAFAPVITGFGKELTGKIIANRGVISPEDVATMQQSSMAKLVEMGGLSTQAYKQASQAIQNMSDAILQGITTGSTVRSQKAQAEYQTKLGERAAEETRVSSTQAPGIIQKLYGKSDMTVGEEEGAARAITPFMQRETEAMRISLGDQKQREQDARLLQSLITKHLPPKYVDNLPDLTKKLASNTLSVRDIARLVSGKNVTPEEYDKVRDAIQSAYSEFASGREGTGTYAVDQQAEMDKYQIDSSTFHQVMSQLGQDMNYMTADPRTQYEMRQQRLAEAKASIAAQPIQDPVLENLRKIQAGRVLHPELQPEPVHERANTAADATESESFYDKLNNWMGGYGKTKEGKPVGGRIGKDIKRYIMGPDTTK